MSYLLDVSGNIRIKNDLTINGNIISKSIVTSNTTITPHPDVSGNTFVNDMNISGVLDIFPPGTIMAFVLLNAPVGWLLCNGQSVSRITYANLYTAIGNTFGSGDGTTTFNVPNYQAAFLRGAGTYDSSHFATLNNSQMDTIKSHTHGVIDGINNLGHFHMQVIGSQTFFLKSGGFRTYGTSNDKYTSLAYTNITIQNAGGTETRPYNWAVNWFIKY